MKCFPPRFAAALLLLALCSPAAAAESPAAPARPGIELPWIPRDFVTSRDGKFAAFLATPTRRTPRDREEPPGRGLIAAVVDLDKGELVAEKTFDVPMHAIAIDDHHIYVSAAQSAFFLVLNRRDLSEVKRLFTRAPRAAITTMGTRLLVGNALYSLPGVEPGAPGDLRLAAPDDSQNRAFSVPAGTLYRGILSDAAGAPKLLLPQSGSWPSFPAVPFTRQQAATTALEPWGGAIPSFTTRSGLDLSDRPAALAGAVLPDAPALVYLTLAPKHREGPEDPGKTDTLQVKVEDLLARQLVATLPLAELDRTPNPYAEPPAFVRGVTGKILTVHRDRLYITPTSRLPLNKLATPVHFEPAQSLLALDPAQPNRLTYKAHGGKGPLRYALKSPVEGVTLDPASGVLTIDPARLLPRAVALLAGSVGSSSGSAAPPDPPSRVAHYLRQLAQRNPEMPPVPSGFLPFAVNLGISASDAEQLTATLEHAVLLPVQESLVIEAVKERDAANEAARQAALDAQDAARARGTGPANAEVLRRVQELERRVQSLEAQNETLRDLLSRQSTTRPAH